jgi:hypothetical protein
MAAGYYRQAMVDPAVRKQAIRKERGKHFFKTPCRLITD